MRLRKWGTVVLVAASLSPGHTDPLTQALDYHSHMTSVAERANSITAPSRSVRSATPALLETIKMHESRGDYTAVNPTGCDGAPCGGAYQLHSWYASSWAADAGYPHMSADAATWPPATQDAVALHLYYSTATPGWHWCEFTSYC
jgi:hypothetical protein